MSGLRRKGMKIKKELILYKKNRVERGNERKKDVKRKRGIVKIEEEEWMDKGKEESFK